MNIPFPSLIRIPRKHWVAIFNKNQNRLLKKNNKITRNESRGPRTTIHQLVCFYSLVLGYYPLLKGDKRTFEMKSKIWQASQECNNMEEKDGGKVHQSRPHLYSNKADKACTINFPNQIAILTFCCKLIPYM